MDRGCDPYREALSAQLDDEGLGMPRQALEDHLASCDACRRWTVQAVWVTRSTRVHSAVAVRDMTDEILAAIRAERRPAPATSGTDIDTAV